MPQQAVHIPGAMQRDPSAVSLETFVLHSLSSIAQETSGRAQAQKDVREAAIKLLEELGVAEFGRPGSRLSIPFPADVTSQLLAVLRGALALGNPRLAEPALSCMHKLVAYAYLQGETASNGRLDDDNVVTQASTPHSTAQHSVVGLTARCGESNSAAIQLQVVKALLTYVTAEHFMAHGDVLMQAIRAVFNTAIGAESADIKNTARSALLQMINTVLKRVGQQILSPGGTPLPSPAHPAFRTSWSHSSGNMEGAATAASAALAAVAAERAASVTSPASPHAGASGGEVGGGGGNGGGGSLVGGDGRAESGGSDVYDSQPLSPAENTLLVHAISQEMTVEAPPCSTGADGSPNTPQAAEAAATAAAEAAAIAASAAQPQVQPQLGQQPSADMAEAADVAAAAADMAELQAALPRIQTSPPTPTSPLSEAGRGGGGGGPLSARRISVSLEPLPGPAQPPSAEQFVAAAVQADARTAQLASLAEQSDLRGLERALDSLPQADPSGALSRRLLARQETPPDPRRALMRDRRASTWRMLTPVERDALIVLTAMSKMASRETGFGAVESYLHQGKLLALDLLVRVLTNPTHDWSHMRPEFAAELRHPLCLVLLRNCTSPYELAGTAAVRLFEAILSAQKLRAGLKAELGALYPLLLLKPIEAAAPDSPHAMVMAAEGLLHVCSHPQVLVDLFVNYDCSLQAANLYERTIKAKLKATALKALLAAIQSLDTWAGPIKSAAAAVALTPEAAAAAVTASNSGELSGDRTEGGAASPLPRDREELQRILADKELKDALLSGIQAFNQNAVKGLRQLVQSGVIADGSPAAAARFLREHAARLDKGQVGELMGRHEDHSVQVMHCYIDSEHFGGLTLDEALRRLLGSFRWDPILLPERPTHLA
ncbi:Brefeldin A-inhibited guanine nucleotide-exchange protein 3 [Chlorella vulgaris]